MGIRYLALGDSYTIGEGVLRPDSWPEQLAVRLRDSGVGVDAPEVIARTGWSVAELDGAIDAARPTGSYDLVSLLVGVNDQYRGVPIDGYRSDFERVLARAITFAGGLTARVFVLSVPDWGVTPFASGRDRNKIAAEIEAFNEVNRKASVAAGVAWVDVTPVSRRHANSVVADGLHPDATQYAEWANLALPVARAALRR